MPSVLLWANKNSDGFLMDKEIVAEKLAPLAHLSATIFNRMSKLCY